MALRSKFYNFGLSACYISICIMYMYSVYIFCILYAFYVLYICICKKNNNNHTGPGGTGGSAKLKSSKGDNTLREGRKGDPLHECCGKKEIGGDG